MKIDVTCSLNNFRQFMIISMCYSFTPPNLLHNEKIFPERTTGHGTVYVEAEDKQTIQKIREITFVQVSDILGIIYNSKSGRSQLKWRSLRDDLGKLTGEVSSNSLVNLFASGTLAENYANTNKEHTL